MPDPMSDSCKKVIVISVVVSMGLVLFCQTVGFFSPAWHCGKIDGSESKNAFDESGTSNAFDESGTQNAFETHRYLAYSSRRRRSSFGRSRMSRSNTAATNCKFHGLFYPDGILSVPIFLLCLGSWLGTLFLMPLVGWMLYKARFNSSQPQSQNNGGDTEDSQDSDNDPLAELFDDFKARLLVVGFCATQFLAGVALVIGLTSFKKIGWSAVLFAWFGMAEVAIVVSFICYKLYQIYQKFGGDDEEEE